MDRKNYNIIIYSTVAIVAIFFVAFRFFNISVQRQMDAQMFKQAKGTAAAELKKTREEEIKEEKKIVEDNKLTPETIKVQKESVLQENQYYWDANTKAILDKTDILERMDETGVFEGNMRTPEQFKLQIQRIDERIREYEQRVQNDPGDDSAHQKLRNLYMLRATVSGLEETVVEK
ncbi:MAG: hypothetical protein JW847_05710 [Candidatus Omnitrophica bacterium]|nr:hypothetical protein [Candidatus Omnitrophota bacterium]